MTPEEKQTAVTPEEKANPATLEEKPNPGQRPPGPRRRREAHRPHLEVVDIEGDVGRDERRAIAASLERLVEAERQAMAPSIWLRTARAQSRRLGMRDYRDRFTHEDAWRLSARFPPGDREHQGLHGRGDAR